VGCTGKGRHHRLEPHRTGVVSAITTEGAREHIEELSQRYTGAPYPWWGGRDEVRVMLRVDVEWLGGQMR
jgi:hypothetical protein